MTKGVKVGNAMYVPQPSRGRAYPGQVIFINYIPQSLQPKPQSNPGQSPKSRTGHGQATPVTQKRATDPLALVGKTLAGYEVGLRHEGDKGERTENP
mgnify:CR=1 FL=1